MLTNFIANAGAGMARNRLNGYKTQIGGVGLILYALVIIIGKIWPDLNLPGADSSWEAAFGMLSAGLTALGFLHKVFKAGADLQTQPVGVSRAKGPVDIETTLSDAAAAMGPK